MCACSRRYPTPRMNSCPDGYTNMESPSFAVTVVTEPSLRAGTNAALNISIRSGSSLLALIGSLLVLALIGSFLVSPGKQSGLLPKLSFESRLLGIGCVHPAMRFSGKPPELVYQ